jgi:hypothetical protein
VGRRNLSSAAALAVCALVAAAPASAGLRWRVLASGAANGAAVSTTTAYVALDASATQRFAARLPSPRARLVRAVDFSRQAVIAIFGEFGCRDHRIAVTAIVQRGSALAVTLVQRPLAPGTAECMAIFPTYRVLSLEKAGLRRPLPTHATVALAPA